MKGKFVIYSGGPRSLNKRLDLALLRLAGAKASITYIPVTDDQNESYFFKFKKYYSHYGIKKIQYFAPDKKYSKKQIEQAFQSSIIYLDGGNTYLFLKNLEASGLKSYLKKFILNGGIIAGQSAGIISISPNIHTASIPSQDADEPIVGFRKKQALNFLSFEFSPHLDINNKKSINELLAYSFQTKNDILACDDGSGLVIENGKTVIIGDVYCFSKGIKTKIS